MSTPSRTSWRFCLGELIDVAPVWIWKPANMRFVWSHTVHLCYSDGRRSVEIDAKEVARGRRVRDVDEP